MNDRAYTVTIPIDWRANTPGLAMLPPPVKLCIQDLHTLVRSKVGRWINTSWRGPKYGVWVLVICADGEVRLMKKAGRKGYRYWVEKGSDVQFMVQDVKRWRAVPGEES